MKLSSDDKTLTITLGEECSIIDVEADTDLLRAVPDNIKKIFLNIDALKEMDTAYIQCIYSLVKEAQERNISINTTGKNKIFDHVCSLYGLKKIEVENFESHKEGPKTADAGESASLPKKLSKNGKKITKFKKQKAEN